MFSVLKARMHLKLCNIVAYDIRKCLTFVSLEITFYLVFVEISNLCSRKNNALEMQ